MRNFQQKNKWRTILESKIVLIFLTIGLLLFAYSIFGFMGKMIDTVKNKKIAEEKIIEMQKNKTKLSADIEKLKTIEGQEESIREKFGLAKDGEGLIMVVEDKTKMEDINNINSAGIFSIFKSWFK